MLYFLCMISLVAAEVTVPPPVVNCQDLMAGQYYCDEPTIDEKTQQAKNCSQETRTVQVACYPAEDLVCEGLITSDGSPYFLKDVACQWTNGKEFSVALLLSVFLGWCGVDRFYLGYPALGLLKFCTVGFMMLGSFIDVILISTQVVGPADGSAYIVDYYGAGVQRIRSDNYTYVNPPVYSGG